MKIFTDDYIVLDFETGGLSHRTRRPVETGLLRYKDGQVKLHHHLVHPPLDGDMEFSIDFGAMNVHGITGDMCKEAGLHPKESARIIVDGSEGFMVWTHNGVKFDFPIMVKEAERCGIKTVDENRWRDSAALYKAWKLQKYPDQFPSLLEFMRSVLNTPRKGLKFNLPLLTAELDLGVRMIDANGSRTDEATEMVTLEVDDYLGLSDADRLMIQGLGAHRAAFDVVVTHGLIQWIRRNLGHLFDPDIKPPEDDIVIRTTEPAKPVKRETSLSDLANETHRER